MHVRKKCTITKQTGFKLGSYPGVTPSINYVHHTQITCSKISSQWEEEKSVNLNWLSTMYAKHGKICCPLHADSTDKMKLASFSDIKKEKRLDSKS